MCGRSAGPQPDHYLICKFGHHRALRHDQVALQIRLMCTALGQLSRVTGLDGVLPDSTDGRKLIPDVYSPEAQEVLDISITHPGAAAYLQDAAVTDGATAAKREGTKTTKYKTAASHAGLTFTPAVFESYGRAGMLFRSWFMEKVSESEDRLPAGWDTNWACRTYSSHFQQRISVALQRGNAETVLRRSRRDH